MTRVLSGFVLALGLVALAFPVAFANPGDPCVTTASGAIACGKVTVVGCGIASAEGSSTSSVHWKFVVSTRSSVFGYQSATDERDGVAYAHTTTEPCATDTCTWGELYADGVLVDAPGGVCFA